MPFIFDDIILLGLAAAPIAGLLGLKKTSENLDGDSARPARSYQPPQGYVSPQQAYVPPVQTYAPQNTGHYAPDTYGYGPYDGFSQGYSEYDAGPPMDEVRIAPNKQMMFYTKAVFEGNVMEMLVDTGATNVAIGDNEWRVLKRYAQNVRTGSATTADNRSVSTKDFTIPYLTVMSSDQGSSVTARDIKIQYIHGSRGHGLLGMAFLSKCEFGYEGNEFVIRG